MSKPGPGLPGPAGLADWLPLFGSICQVLATLGEDAKCEPDESEPRNPTGAAAPRPETGEERG
jgi:hypothetical protein